MDEELSRVLAEHLPRMGSEQPLEALQRVLDEADPEDDAEPEVRATSPGLIWRLLQPRAHGNYGCAESTGGAVPERSSLHGLSSLVGSPSLPSLPVTAR